MKRFLLTFLSYILSAKEILDIGEERFFDDILVLSGPIFMALEKRVKV